MPWREGGRCVVREASQPWLVVTERCFHILDHDRVRFNDLTGKCAVASAGAAALDRGEETGREFRSSAMAAM